MSNKARKTPSGVLLGVLLVAQGAAFADAGYQDTVQITGGQLVDSLRSIPFMPKSFKQMLEPINSRVMLHGNRLASVSKSATQIIDLDQETVTHIDTDRKTYSVTTFAQMRQAIKEVPKKMEEAQEKARQQSPATPANAAPAPPMQVTFEVAVTDPGVSKMINGILAKEQVMTMKAHITDLNPPPDSQVQSVTYSVITDIWSAPEPPEMKEIDDFYLRYGKKLMQGVDMAALMRSMQPAIDGSAIAPLFAKNPGMGSAVQEMTKKMAVEMDKIKGTRILEITRMGGEAMAAPAAAGEIPSAAGASGTPNAASAAGQVTTDTATAAVAQTASKLGAIGSAFGSSMLSAFHRNAPAATPGQPATSNGAAGTAAPATAVLYETTTQKTDFSREPISAAVFDIPAGFTRVDARAAP